MEYLKTYSSEGEYRAALEDEFPRQSVILVGDSNVKFVDEYDEGDRKVLAIANAGYTKVQAQRMAVDMYLNRIPVNLLFDINGDGVVNATDAICLDHRKHLFPPVVYYTVEGNIAHVVTLTDNGGNEENFPLYISQLQQHPSKYVAIEEDVDVNTIILNGSEIQLQTGGVVSSAQTQIGTITAGNLDTEEEEELDIYLYFSYRYRALPSKKNFTFAIKAYQSGTLTSVSLDDYEYDFGTITTLVNSLDLIFTPHES